MSPSPNSPLAIVQSMLLSVTQQAFDAVLITDEQQVIIYFNQGAQHLFGYTTAEVLGQTLQRLIPPPLVEQHAARVHAFIHGTDAVHTLGRHLRVVRGQRKDGTLVSIDVTIARATLDSGASAFVAFIRDITERQLLEDTLRQTQAHLQNQVDESENRYRRLFEQSPDAILVHQNGTVLFANPAALRLVGASALDQVRGRSFFEFLAPEYRGIDRERAMVALRTHTPLIPMEEELVRLDGTRVTVEVAGSVVVYNGQPAIQLVGRDISDRKRRERELQAMADLSVALRQASTRADIAQAATTQVMHLLAADAARLSIFSPDTREEQLTMNSGVLTQPPALSRACLSCTARRLMHHTPNQQATDWRTLVAEPVCHCLEPVRAMLAVPLINQDQRLGTLLVARIAANPFNPSDRHLLSTLAEMVAAALYRAGLHELTERRLQRLNTLRAMDAAISASQDMRTTLNIVLGSVVQQFGGDAASILLNHEQGLMLRYAAGLGFRTRIIESTALRLGEGVAGRAALERTFQQASTMPNWHNRRSLRAMEGFVAHCAAPLLARNRVIGVVEIFKRTPLQPDAEWVDYFSTLAGHVALALERAHLIENLQHSHHQLEQAYEATIEGWSMALELRDQETQGHTRRVTEWTVRLARAMNLSPDVVQHIRRGALLHDIGKMAVPDAILLKPGPLSAGETDLMRRHPEYARQMLSGIDYLRPALDIPYYHHERWDGSGYPEGLRGTDIPLAARLFAVVDVWDALSSDRPYRLGWPAHQVRDYLRHHAGILFDPDMVTRFLELLTAQPTAS